MFTPIDSRLTPPGYPSSDNQSAVRNRNDGQGAGVKVDVYSSQVSIGQSSETFTYTQSAQAQSWSARTSGEVSAANDVVSPPSSEANPYARTILSAIEGQLMRDMADGADAEALASRLQAGLDGFLKGYNEALTQLNGLPGFDDEIRSEVEQTRNQVLDGLAQFADRHGIEYTGEKVVAESASSGMEMERKPLTGSLASAKPKAIAGQQVLESAVRDLRILTEYVEQSAQEVTYQKQSATKAQRNDMYAYQMRQENRFAFNVTTQEGDVVTINVQAGQSAFAADGRAGESLRYTEQTQSLGFSVEGDLNADELEAITGLLKQVGEVADLFFDGNMDGAVSQALALTYDASEIDSFGVQLNRSVSEAAFRQVEQGEGAGLESLQQKLAAAMEQASYLNLPKSLIADLTDWFAPQVNPQHHWAHNAGNLIRTLL